MILDLDDPRSTDPTVAGAKGAGLARARRAGLPVLPGIVVPAVWSLQAMAHGSATLPARGSGGARSVIIGMGISAGLSEALAAAVDALGEPVIVRSSSVLEGDGAWSGAFTSYQGISIGDLDTAVRGCWASAFTVATLARTHAAGLEPGASPMAIVVQRSIDPVFGGVARIEGDGIVINAVRGTPAPLVQGWVSGVLARVALDGDVVGEDAARLLGRATIARIADILQDAHQRIGSTACEWAAMADGSVVMLQVWVASIAASQPSMVQDVLRDPRAALIARRVRRSPGRLGTALVLPWAIGEDGEPSHEEPPADVMPAVALSEAMAEADALIGMVWRAPVAVARSRAQRMFAALRSHDPSVALRACEGLVAPDPRKAARIRSLLARVRIGLVEAGEVAEATSAWHTDPRRAADVLAGRVRPGRIRIGVDQWDPFQAAVVLGSGRTIDGVPAAPGVGYGRLHWLPDPGRASRFRPRDVLVVLDPVPSLGALLWDAAGLVTIGGGPAAHLFEAARSVGVPAISGVPLDRCFEGGLAAADGRYALVVDGGAGVVAVTDW